MVEKCTYDTHNTYVKCGSQATFVDDVDDVLGLDEKQEARRLDRASGEERRRLLNYRTFRPLAIYNHSCVGVRSENAERFV